jgi:GTPase Era involved in 16S rRNA processing
MDMSLSQEMGTRSNQDVKSTEDKLQKLIKLIDSAPHPKIMWDETIDRYVQTVSKMKRILNEEPIKENVPASLLRNIGHFVDRCQSPEFHIAFVGAIKAGKSTLINALLGKNLASTSVTPETATLTKFRASKNRNYVKITFYSSAEWEELWKSVQKAKADVFLEEYQKLEAEAERSTWLDKEMIMLEFDSDEELQKEIEKWTSSKKATHYFVKEVEVGLTEFHLPEQVVFVDTPGLDDPVKYRSDITRGYIDRANAVLVCVKSDAMTGGELATIYSVFANTRYNPEKVYIIGTQLDTLNKPEQNWKEQRDEWLKHLKRKDCFGNLTLAEKNLIGTAAHLYNLAIHYQTLDQDTIDFELDPIAKKFRIRNVGEELDKLIHFSNIEQVKYKLQDEIIAKHKRLLVQDLKQAYVILKEDLVNLFLTIKEQQQEVLRATNAGIEEIRAKREEILRQLKETELEKEKVNLLLKKIKEDTTKQAEQLYHDIRNMGGVKISRIPEKASR